MTLPLPDSGRCACGGDSRVSDRRGYRRRRECLACGTRWTTYELRAEHAPGVIAARPTRAAVERVVAEVRRALAGAGVDDGT